jgi:RsiW-degrading membrane proteinase PrsW (M82 family)
MPPNVSSPEISAESLRRVARNRAGFWLSLLLAAVVIALAGVALYLGFLDLLDGLIPKQFWPFIQVLAALAPALAWLAFFIPGVRDGAMRRAALLLLLLSGALYLITVDPLLRQAFLVSEWLRVSWWSELLGRVLVVAPLEMLFVYVVVRYGVYPTLAFQHLVDGPIYGVAAGLGVASAINLQIANAPGFADLGQAILQSSEMALSYAALAALLGYFIGQARFRRTHVFYLAAGLLLTTLIHGLFFFALDFVRAQNLFLTSLNGLALAGLFALFTFAVIFWRIRRSHQAFIRMAALLEIQEEAQQPPSLLADVIQMVESKQLETPPAPPPSRAKLKNSDDGDDELASLKKSWESLIAEQEAHHD